MLFTKRLVFACLALSHALLTGLRAAETPATRPNILIILADDLGYWDLGFQGCSDIPTPHLDALARGGVRCTSGYVSSSMCSPSRAGLLTGRSQSRFGHEINWKPLPGTEHCGLPLAEKTLADQLKAAGYRTGIVGKWHLGESPQFHPNRRGFEEFFGFVGGGHNYFCETYTKSKNGYVSLLERNGQTEKTTGYLTSVLGREAASFIRRHKTEPWFLYAAFNAPHTPLQATPELLARVKTIPNEQRRTYVAMVCGLDDAVGEILRQLRDEGLEDRTLVFFLSDNGGPLDRNGSRNDPLRGEKGTFWEGGIRVPFVASWKGVLPAGKTYDRPVSSLDIVPTALALASADSMTDHPLDGVNLIPYLTGARDGDPHETLCWRMKARSIWAVRRGDDKLVMQQTQEPCLYDLRADLAERTDLAAQHRDRRAALQQAYDAWAATLPEPLWDVTPPAPTRKPPLKRPAHAR